MADIKIYGTLKNDTAEPVVYGEEVYLSEKQKYLPEVLESIELSVNRESFRTLTAEEVQNICNNFFNQG